MSDVYKQHGLVKPNAIGDSETRRFAIPMYNALTAIQKHLSTTTQASAVSTSVSSGSSASSSTTTTATLNANDQQKLNNAVTGALNEGTTGVGIYDTKDSSKNLLFLNVNNGDQCLSVAKNNTTKTVDITANIGQVINTLAAGNDNRFPTADQKNALAGTDGTPSATDKYVTNSDSRNTNARTPTAHASTHITGSTDAIQLATTLLDGLLSHTDWTTFNGKGNGNVVGPASAVDSHVVFFDGTTGKLIKDSGLTLSGSNTGDETTSTIKTKLGAATDSLDGYMTAIDHTALTADNAKVSNVQSDWNASSGLAVILNKPTIPAAQVNSDWNAVSGVAEILNKPSIPSAQVQTDWNATSGLGVLLNKPTLGGAAALNVGTTTGTVMAGDDSRVLGLLQVEQDRQEPTGFIAEPGPPTDSTVGFVNATRTFTIAPTGASFSFYQSGTKYTISTSQSIVISNTEGTHFIYFNNGSLAETTTYSNDIILKYVYVANIYWDATNAKQIMNGDERHGCVMDGITHLHDHMTLHTLLQSGGGLNTLSVDASGNLDSSIQFGIDETIQWDEDLYWDLSGRTSTAPISNYYRLGSTNTWRVSEGNSFPVVNTGSGRVAYNLLTGSTWSLSEISNTNYGLVHVFAMNDATRRFGTIMGQADYSTEANARSAVLTEVSSLILNGMPSQEWKFLGSLIVQTSNSYGNSVKGRFVSVDTNGTTYVDLRTTIFPTAGASGTPAGVTSLNTRTGAITLVGTDIPLADGTTRGAMPALTGSAGQYLDNTGSWSTPAGGGVAWGILQQTLAIHGGF